MFKRALDVLVSACLLIVAFPVLLLSVILIRLTSQGPALFRQSRMGRDFKTFQIIKLRTMAHAADGLAYTLGRDPRITRLGHWLRRTKVDELPQLWNVLRGEMSLVGPRPVIPELTEEFRSEYAMLLRARPGLTDPASLKYSQEASLLETVPEPLTFFKAVVTPDKLAISLAYMHRANLWTDVKTLAMTGAICCYPALNRLYGSIPLPKNPIHQPMPVLQADSLYVDFGGTLLPTDRDFVPQHSRARHAGKTIPATPIPPWILGQMRRIRQQSTTNHIRGGGSRL